MTKANKLVPPAKPVSIDLGQRPSMKSSGVYLPLSIDTALQHWSEDMRRHVPGIKPSRGALIVLMFTKLHEAGWFPGHPGKLYLRLPKSSHR